MGCGFLGSYSSVQRFVKKLKEEQPAADLVRGMLAGGGGSGGLWAQMVRTSS